MQQNALSQFYSPDGSTSLGEGSCCRGASVVIITVAAAIFTSRALLRAGRELRCWYLGVACRPSG